MPNKFLILVLVYGLIQYLSDTFICRREKLSNLAPKNEDEQAIPRKVQFFIDLKGDEKNFVKKKKRKKNRNQQHNGNIFDILSKVVCDFNMGINFLNQMYKITHILLKGN